MLKSLDYISRRPLKVAAGFAIAVSLIALLVACGGGGNESTSTIASTTGTTAKALAVPPGWVGRVPPPTLAWSPVAITDTANPGSRQDIPVTFTASANLSNIVLAVVPALQSSVTVTPSSFAALQKGQVVTVTLSVAPAANAALGAVQGTVQVRLGSSTIASPLAVNIVVVAAEVINGISVPPEPPADLNNATLAGFDANGNGVRDDVERILAKQFGSMYPKFTELTTYAKAEQAFLITGSPSQLLTISSLVICSNLNTDDTRIATNSLLNSAERNRVYATLIASAPPIGVREIRRTCVK